MFKELGNLAQLLTQTNKISGQMKAMQQRLSDLRCDGTSSGAEVLVTVTGQSQVARVQIDPELVAKGDVANLERCVAEAVADAMSKVKAAAAEEMKGMTEGLGIPGLGGMLSSMGIGG